MIRIVLVLIAVTLFSCSTLSTQGRRPAGEYTGGYNYQEHIDSTAIVTCQEFFDLLNGQTQKPDTIFKALTLLKTQKPKFFSRYVLIPNSESLHGSDWEAPRAVVFGGDAQMVLTFNGKPKQAGYGQLEAMCFDTTKASFAFYEITFPKEATGDLDALTPEQIAQPFVISPPNGYSTLGHDCTMCHSVPAHPV